MPKGIYIRKPCDEKTIFRLRENAKKLRKPNNCICLECGNGFKKKPFALRNGEGKYCSHKCKSLAQKKTMIGSGNHQYGTHWQKGENNPNWKGGREINGYYWDWPSIKRKVKERDNNICQVCGIQSGVKYKRRHAVHHIDHNKKNNSLKNLITICVSCHCKEHKPHFKSPVTGRKGGVQFSSN